MTKIEAIERLNQCKGDLAAWMEYGRSMERQLRDAVARAERAEAALAAVPWQALLNISHTLDASDAASDSDEAALLAFLNQYAPWVPNESEE